MKRGFRETSLLIACFVLGLCLLSSTATLAFGVIKSVHPQSSLSKEDALSFSSNEAFCTKNIDLDCPLEMRKADDASGRVRLSVRQAEKLSEQKTLGPNDVYEDKNTYLAHEEITSLRVSSYEAKLASLKQAGTAQAVKEFIKVVLFAALFFFFWRQGQKAKQHRISFLRKPSNA